jgi:predicted aminopeptidase
MRAVCTALALALALLATGCLPIRYVTQAAAGQEDLNRRGIAISDVVEGGYLDKRTRSLLAQVAPIKAFGERHGLKRTKNYERYVWINRPAVVWVVSACDPLGFHPYTWHFPIVGSITYTGWFDRKEAKAYGEELARHGWDVDVRPSGAYSTLGWFDDPILSTMLEDGPDALGELADVVLHETLHASFFVPGQSTLNESVASFYGDELASKYLDETVGPESIEKRSFVAEHARTERRGQRMKAAYDELAHLYETSASREDKLAEKARILATLRADLKIKRPISNATLIQYKTYGSGRAELEELLQVCGGSFPRMLHALDGVRSIAAKAGPHADPATLLRPVIANGC